MAQQEMASSCFPASSSVYISPPFSFFPSRFCFISFLQQSINNKNKSFISMSSDLFIHGDSYYSSSSSLFHCPSDADFQFLSDSYSPDFPNPSIYLLQPYNPHEITLPAVDNFIPMQESSLSSSNGFQYPSNFDLKNEESHLGFTSNSFNHPLEPLCFDPSDNNPAIAAAAVEKSLLHRSFSEKPGFQSLLMESPNFPSPESEFFSSQLRRVFSTGDLQNSGISLEELNFKVGRYSAEERKERISKYRAKRTQRNFNKTIKYACRKTLADNRLRVRGRFARNDEPGEIPKAACSTGEEDELDFWMEELPAGGEEGTVRGKQYNEVYGEMQFQYCGF